METIKSITAVEDPGIGWRVRVRLQGGVELYHGTGSRWTMQQAQMAADSLRRDIRNNGVNVSELAE